MDEHEDELLADFDTCDECGSEDEVGDYGNLYLCSECAVRFFEIGGA